MTKGKVPARSSLDNYIDIDIMTSVDKVPPKPVTFVGSSLDDLREFPPSARHDCGYQLDKVQHGDNPDDWKPMSTVGAGVRELRVRDAGGAFRLMYVAKFPEAVYVLHVFQKKTRTTAKKDLALGKARYQEMTAMRKTP